MPDTPRCPVYIISGFLGSGKTTFIQRILREMRPSRFFPSKDDPRPLIILENDFGEQSFDAELLRESEVEVRELAQGCICCTLFLDFHSSLLQIAKDYNPAALIIEPSGLGRVSDILPILERPEIAEHYRYVATTTMVDAEEMEDYLLNFGDFYEDQIQHADLLLLNRAKDLELEKVYQLSLQLAQLAPKAIVKNFDLVQGDRQDFVGILEEAYSSSDEVLGEVSKDHEPCNEHDEHAHDCDCGCHYGDEHNCTCGCHHGDEQDCHCHCGHEHGHDHEDCHEHNHEHDHAHHPSASDIFTTYSLPLTGFATAEDVKTFMLNLGERLNGKLLRAKGLLQLDSGEYLRLQWVPNKCQFEEVSADNIDNAQISFILTNEGRDELLQLRKE